MRGLAACTVTPCERSDRADRAILDALAASNVLVNLSHDERIVHVLAQAWLVGTPLIVQAGAPAPEGISEESDPRVRFETFVAGLDQLRLESGPSQLSRQGLGVLHVMKNHSRPDVLEGSAETISDLAV